MKRDTLRLSQHQFIETYLHGDRRVFIAYSSGCSAMFCERKELLRFLKIPKSIPMRQALESWLASLADMDAQRQQPSPDGLSSELLATGFGPEAHGLDETDPCYQTRMVT